MKKRIQRWQFVAPYLKRYQSPFVWGIILVVVSTALYQVPPWMVKVLVERLEHGGGMRSAVYPVAMMLAATLIENIMMYFQRLWMIQASRKIEYEMRSDLFLLLQAQPRKFFDQHSIGDLMSHITNDLDRVRDYLGPAILHLVRMVSMVVFTLACVWLLSWKLALVGLVPLLLVPAAVNRILEVMHNLYSRIQKNLGELNAFVQDAVSGIQIIKAYGKEDAFYRRFESSSDQLRANSLRVAFFTSSLWPAISLLGSFGILMAIWYGARMTIQGEITIGTLTAVLIYLLKIQFPIAGLGWVASLFQRSNAALDRLIKLSGSFPHFSPGSVQAPPEPLLPPLEAGLIELRALNFGYDSKTPVLKNISLKIFPGSSLGIVGPTGAGKTALMNILCGVYTPPPQTLFLNGRPREDYSDEEWQSCFSLSPQDGFLFSQTIRENILFGTNARSTLSVEDAGRVSGFSRDLPQIPGGYDAQLGERGINLSGGQKQRVGLARALLSNTPVLCLDDTLSALDTETEQVVLENLRKNLADRTSIIISHRYSAVSACDLIIFLKDGEIVEQGAHVSLMARDGLYAGVYRKQMILSSLENH